MKGSGDFSIGSVVWPGTSKLIEEMGEFLTLRMAPNAQKEIQEYASAVATLVAERFPRTWDVFKS